HACPRRGRPVVDATIIVAVEADVERRRVHVDRGDRIGRVGDRGRLVDAAVRRGADVAGIRRGGGEVGGVAVGIVAAAVAAEDRLEVRAGWRSGGAVFEGAGGGAVADQVDVGTAARTGAAQRGGR